MKTILFIISTILITKIKSAAIASVHPLISNIFSVSGTPCTYDTDCDDMFDDMFEIPSNLTAFWTCVNETNVVQSDNTIKEISFCQLIGCDTDNDCDTNEKCYTINQCDDDNIFYDEVFDLYSSFCFDNGLCDTIYTDGAWTSESMCYTGDDESIYSSAEQAVICGGTCPIASDPCIEGEPINCEASCCTTDWDQDGCLKLLFTEYMIYTVIALSLLLLCCCGCCCCIYKARKRRGETYDDMDNQTNHYNVYI